MHLTQLCYVIDVKDDCINLFKIHIERVRDDPKEPNDSGEVPKPNGVVGGSIPDHEIVSLLDEKTSQVVKRLLCSTNNTTYKQT